MFYFDGETRIKKKIKTNSMGKLNEENPSEDLEKKLTADQIKEVNPSKEVVRLLTEEYMAREGISENIEMREIFKNSYFFPICYDDAIDGVNPMTQSIIYNYMRLGQLRIIFVEWHSPDLGDTLYGGESMVRWIENLTDEETEGKVPPSLCLYKSNIEYWADIQEGGW